jgi:hypothetical protein
LKETRSEIDAAYQQIMSAFEVIGSEVGRLVAGASGFGHNKADADPPATARHERAGVTDDPFAALKSALLRLNLLLGKGSDLRNRMQETAGQASETSSRLSHYVGQVSGISNGLHLKALNAIVKTAHLDGRGRTLEVLAQEVNRLSDQSSEFVPNVVNLLDTITALARELVGESSEVTRGAQVDGGNAKMSIDAGIQNISRVYDRFRGDSSAALERSQTLQAAISQTRSDLCFLPELIDQLEAHINELEKMVQLLSPWVDRKKMTQEEIDGLVQRYTMDRERAVHKQVIEGIDELKAEDNVENLITKTTPEKDKDKDDLGDNVELF